MGYYLTDEQYEKVRGYFELSVTAISDDEMGELLALEPECAEIMRAVTRVDLD